MRGDLLPPLDDDLSDIRQPNFRCANLSEQLRAGGHEIQRKAEQEQAAVIHFLLGHYLKHGSDWRETAGAAHFDAIAISRAREQSMMHGTVKDEIARLVR